MLEVLPDSIETLDIKDKYHEDKSDDYTKRGGQVYKISYERIEQVKQFCKGVKSYLESTLKNNKLNVSQNSQSTTFVANYPI